MHVMYLKVFDKWFFFHSKYNCRKNEFQNNPKTVLEWYGLAEKTELEEMSQSLENKVPMDQSNNCLDKTRTLETLGFNEEYRTDHVALFHLVTHSQRREPEEYFHQIVMALYLLEVLKTTSYFDQFKSCASGNIRIFCAIVPSFISKQLSQF